MSGPPAHRLDSFPPFCVQMARQSIPANPLDEQILALQRQIANGKNELDVLRDQMAADKAEAQQAISAQVEQIHTIRVEKAQLIAELTQTRMMNEEKCKELAYLQEQLEIFVNEKIDLRTQVSQLEAKLETSVERSQLAATEEQVARLKTDLEQALHLIEDLEGSRLRISELERQLEQQRLCLQDPMSLPAGPPTLRLRDLQARIQTLTQAFRS